MRSVLLLAPAAILACAPPPKPTSPGRTGELTVQQCQAAPADAVPPGSKGSSEPPPAAGQAPAAPAAPAPQVRVGELALPAGGDAEAIQKVFAEALPKVRRCYQQTLENVPGLEGKLTVVFRIETTGKVASADSRAGFHAGVTACVEDVVRALRFPASETAVEASLPLTFRLPDEAAPAPAPAGAPAGGDPAAAPAAPATFPGDADAFASSVVAQAIQERADAIIGCARPDGSPVQLGFDVTVGIRAATITDARVDGLLDPSIELCIAGVLRGVALAAAPQTATGARCELVLRPR